MDSSRLLRYISSLSDEDRKRYKPLIEEALLRDKALAQVFQEARRQADMYEEHSVRLAETAREFHGSLLRLNQKLAEVAGKAETVLAATAPDQISGVVSTLRH